MAEEYSYVLDETGSYRYEKTKKKKNTGKIIKLGLVIAAAVFVGRILPDGHKTVTAPSAPAAVVSTESNTGFIGLAERLDGSICTITSPGMGNSFFGRMVSNQSYTGAVISSDGYILTSGDAAERQNVTVRLSDGAEYPAEVVSYDSRTDCTILKIERNELVPIEFADSSSLTSGVRVASVGRILNSQLGTTMTLGTICGVNSGVELSGGQSVNLLQTDAAAENSAGCMLFDEGGRAVGMIISFVSSGNSEISLAVPSNDIMQVIETETGAVTSSGGPVIGIRGSDTAHGIWIEAVMKDSPAERAGIKNGDLILKADGQTVKSVAELNRIRDTHSAGDKMTLSVYRDGEMLEIEIIL